VVFPPQIAIHDPLMPGDLRSEGFTVEPGYLSIVLITPSQIVTSNAVKGLEIERRKCRFHSENEGMKVFSDYSRNGCIFECQLEQAYKW